MKNHALYFMIGMLLLSTCLFAQTQSHLSINKINGSWHKTIPLPVSLRVITHDEDVIILRVDSITNTCFYGNKGEDSIPLSDIATINLRGRKEVIKYAAVAVCGLGVFQNIPVVTFGLYRNDDRFIYIGLAVVATFASLGTILYFHPRTRFHTTHYTFRTK